ncbi:interaptin [Iris pallida]|uniref:Interaptin n=1 Tax=Iris pallida TaxID=29817 RepID=A0AAX6IE26_IRIPA|nr:interaptin [Iris pallida]
MDAVDFSPCCAFVALHLMSRSSVPELAGCGGMVLLGSAQLLGLIIERAQRRRDGLEEKLRRAESEVREMRLQRTEDAKANDRVVGIFASHEQSWIADRKRLKHQIHALVNELQCLKARSEEAATRLNKRAVEAECATRLKEEAFAEEERRRGELEEKLRVSEELREKASSALADLVSSQRDLQAEIGCALRQAEEARQELAEVLDKKEEAISLAEKLSEEIAKVEKDMEQKDKILSAMLRKSKLDSADKEVLQKEVRIAKAKKKQAELETDRWRNKWESRHKKGPKSSLPDVGSSEQSSSSNGYGYNTRTLLLEYLGQEWQNEHNSSESKEENVVAAVKCLDHYLSSNSRQDLVTADIEHLQNWVRLEVEKQTSILEQRHYEEVEAFVEQMRVKDEKLAAIRWRIVSMEVQSKWLHSRIEALDGNLSQSRADNLKLQARLLDREEEIKSLKERFGVSVHQKNSNSGYSSDSWSEMRLREKKSTEKDRDRKNYRDRTVHDIVTISSVDSAAAASHRLRINEISSEGAESLESSSGEQEKSITLVTLYPSEIVEEDKEVTVDSGHSRMQKSSHKEVLCATKSATVPKPLMKKDSSGKMDIQALGVAFKIKRLKQQLLVLEKLAGMDHNVVNDSDGSDDNKQQQPPKGFVLVVSLLNKQVKRFQSLEEKTDDLCRRMSANSGSSSHRDLPNGKTTEQRKILHGFLEETFQLQRYMVATGQKLMDIQSKISRSFGSIRGLEESAGFNIEQFADVVRSLFREIQRGLELRIARMIGDVEGTLACNGILHM